MTNDETRSISDTNGPTDEFELEGKSESQQIMELFHSMPNATVREVSEACIKGEMWDDDQLYGFQVTHGMARVRRALGTKDIHKVPFAAPITGGKDPIWKETSVMDQTEMFFVITSRIEAVEADIESIRALIALCIERFECAPDLPTWDN